MANIEVATEEAKFLATLVRGEHYSLRNFAWDIGRTIVVGESQMLHLEEHAVDSISTSDGEGLTKDKFEFEPYEGDHPIGYKFPSDDEVDAKERAAKQRERSRRIALARMEPKAPTPRAEAAPRSRSRTRG
jgi:hypothetical protein